MEYLNWNIEADSENIREGAIELRARTAEHMYYRLFESQERAQKFINSPRTYWRRQCLEKLELIMGRSIHGKVLEIGAGTAWCSAELSIRDEIEKVYALEYDEYSVTELMPLVFRSLKANAEKVVPVLGSYNRMECEDHTFDLVISVAAMHHSENLRATFEECFRVLKPGGFIIALEHCHPNSYTIEAAKADDEKLISPEWVKALYGDETLEVQAKDNSDHNYRLCEWETYCYEAGYNVLPYVFDLKGEKANDSIFTNPQPFKGFSNRVFQPYFAQDRSEPVFDNLMLVAQKPGGGGKDLFVQTNIGMSKKSFWG